MSGENMLSKYQHTPLALGFTIVVILCWVGRGILVVCMLLLPPWLEGPEGGAEAGGLGCTLIPWGLKFCVCSRWTWQIGRDACWGAPCGSRWGWDNVSCT